MNVSTSRSTNHQAVVGLKASGATQFSEPLANGGTISVDQLFPGSMFDLSSMSDSGASGDSLGGEIASMESKSVGDRLREQLAAQHNLNQADWHELFGSGTSKS